MGRPGLTVEQRVRIVEILLHASTIEELQELHGIVVHVNDLEVQEVLVGKHAIVRNLLNLYRQGRFRLVVGLAVGLPGVGESEGGGEPLDSGHELSGTLDTMMMRLLMGRYNMN